MCIHDQFEKMTLRKLETKGVYTLKVERSRVPGDAIEGGVQLLFCKNVHQTGKRQSQPL